MHICDVLKRIGKRLWNEHNLEEKGGLFYRYIYIVYIERIQRTSIVTIKRFGNQMYIYKKKIFIKVQSYKS